jgi:hypothetical protein
MALHPIPSEFPYICGKFSFLFTSVEEQNLQDNEEVAKKLAEKLKIKKGLRRESERN